MAHYAFLNEDNIVTEVITGKDEHEDGIDWEAYYGNVKGQVCKRTSYHTMGGLHTAGGTPFRKNYAGAGFMYDETLDAFIAPKPYPSWILNTDTCLWEAPIPFPSIEPNQAAFWNEEEQVWKIFNPEV